MKPALIDTDILSLFLRNEPNVVANFTAYLAKYARIDLSIITYYEIVSGLKSRDAQRQMATFLEFVSFNSVLPLTEESVTISAEAYANLRAAGTPVDDIDLLIAGVAIANELTLVTRNIRHFDRIAELEIVDWSASSE